MKRGESGLSLLVAVNKPLGLSSHDVVNRCRTIFKERRVGHTGTLDPAASGVLPICIGPATKLDPYLTGHDKGYRVRIAFGYETTTDDEEGQKTAEAAPAPFLLDEGYAAAFVESLVGPHKQLPPSYSAVKVKGMKSYEAARKGLSVELEFRDIQIISACLIGVCEDEKDGAICWDVDFSVSKGTYIRSLARDIGRMLDCPAHVRALHRSSCGAIVDAQAVSLVTLSNLGEACAIDPVAALGLRFAFADEIERFVSTGTKLYAPQLALNRMSSSSGDGHCACMGSTFRSPESPSDGEIVSVIVRNRLKALYRYSLEEDIWKAACVFSTSVFRG